MQVLGAGVIVPINQSINVEATYQYNRFLFNNIFINNGIQSNQQNAVSLMITYRLTKGEVGRVVEILED